MIVELDGGSHNTQIRSQRDAFVDEAFTQANIPVLHLSVQNFYEQNQIMTQVQNALANKL
jgi:very-short-patch-repair endonuclease